jgi:hypothetical protein
MVKDKLLPLNESLQVLLDDDDDNTLPLNVVNYYFFLNAIR